MVSPSPPASLHSSWHSAPFPAPGTSSSLVLPLISVPVPFVPSYCTIPLLPLLSFSPASDSFSTLYSFSPVKSKAHLCSYSSPVPSFFPYFHGKSLGHSPVKVKSLISSAWNCCCKKPQAWQNLCYSPHLHHLGDSTPWKLCS